MKKKLFYLLIALLLFSSLVFGACAPKPTEEVAVEPVSEVANEPATEEANKQESVILVVVDEQVGEEFNWTEDEYWFNH